jgi:uncharacterized membrane protein
MEYLLNDALGAYNRHSGWIIWNLFLAFIPLAISFWLFRWSIKSRSFLWWIGLVVYIAFLPNAPYLLTDIIHLIQAIRAGYSAWLITLIFIPLHLCAILLGLEAYVLCLLNQGYYLRRQGAGRFVIWSELITHVLCAVGVYLGRFRRFNSWDLVTQLDTVLIHVIDDLTTKRPLFVIAILFVVITISYFVMKQITLGLLLRIRYVFLNRKKSN